MARLEPTNQELLRHCAAVLGRPLAEHETRKVMGYGKTGWEEGGFRSAFAKRVHQACTRSVERSVRTDLLERLG